MVIIETKEPSKEEMMEYFREDERFIEKLSLVHGGRDKIPYMMLRDWYYLTRKCEDCNKGIKNKLIANLQ
ncbi:hypothetical protein K9L16_02905 [Candidatus Pacearchaeota archaeon]|nr:hypothetical protein [Candidatus Pacearchaeota archaeon]